MAQDAEPYAIEKSKKELGQMESILGAEQTITALCEDIIRHYEDNRQNELTGKAMIVAYSRAIAVRAVLIDESVATGQNEEETK